VVGIRSAVLIAVAVALLGGCGGGHSTGEAAATTTAPPPEPVTTTGPPSLGCDVIVLCLPETARAALERCPASRLDARGRAARRRLERLLARIDEVDLHNEQAYEASDAAMAALAELENGCR
jgi:hypothetical protein